MRDDKENFMIPNKRIALSVIGVSALLFAVLACCVGCDGEVSETEAVTKLVSPMAEPDITSESGAADTVTVAPDTETTKQEETQAPVKPEPIETLTDISAYEQYMDPGDTTEYLTLVSREHMLPSTHIPTDLCSLADTRKDGRATQQMREYAAKSMEAMFTELRAAGYKDVSITSAYRSYSYQEYLFNYYLSINNNDYDYVATFSNPPGSSEHQTGLCADLHNLSSADISFSKKEAYIWLRDNCWKFGFILRYPEDKVDVTGISFEPWHYRYVGRYHAKRIFESGMCLEEYIVKYYPELMGNEH